MADPTKRTLYAILWWDDDRKTNTAPLKHGQLFGPFKTATLARKVAREITDEARSAGRLSVYAQVLPLARWYPAAGGDTLTLEFDRLLDGARLTQLTRANRELKARVKELEALHEQ